MPLILKDFRGELHCVGMRLHWETQNDLARRWQTWQREGRAEKMGRSWSPKTLGPEGCQGSKQFPAKMNPDLTNRVKKQARVDSCSSTSSSAESRTLKEPRIYLVARSTPAFEIKVRAV